MLILVNGNAARRKTAALPAFKGQAIHLPTILK